MFERRDGEEQLPFDPAQLPADAGLVFIGKINSPWKSRGQCPKNMRQAREAGHSATVQILEGYRSGLKDLKAGDTIILLTWLDRAVRDLIVQFPRHAEAPRGTFSLRSPVRPNPVGLHVVGLVAVDAENGVLTIDATDTLDQTPVIDIKPWFASTDKPNG